MVIERTRGWTGARRTRAATRILHARYPFVSMAAALSWAVSDADGGVTCRRRTRRRLSRLSQSRRRLPRPHCLSEPGLIRIPLEPQEREFVQGVCRAIGNSPPTSAAPLARTDEEHS
jgi:hypothetical protein